MKQKFHQNKRLFSLKNVDINQIVVCNKPFLVKRVLNISSAINMLKELHLYVYFSLKWVHIEETLMKLNIYLFLRKDDELLEK